MYIYNGIDMHVWSKNNNFLLNFIKISYKKASRRDGWNIHV